MYPSKYIHKDFWETLFDNNWNNSTNLPRAIQNWYFGVGAINSQYMRKLLFWKMGGFTCLEIDNVELLNFGTRDIKWATHTHSGPIWASRLSNWINIDFRARHPFLINSIEDIIHICCYHHDRTPKKTTCLCWQSCTAGFGVGARAHFWPKNQLFFRNTHLPFLFGLTPTQLNGIISAPCPLDNWGFSIGWPFGRSAGVFLGPIAQSDPWQG